MNTEKIAKGWALIAEGAMELSLAYEGLDSANVAEPVARTGSAGAGGSVGPPLPPLAPASLQEQHVNTALGACPDHGVAWTVREGGVAKDGKPYNAFWRCNQKVGDGWCKRRPVKAWTDTHPVLEAA